MNYVVHRMLIDVISKQLAIIAITHLKQIFSNKCPIYLCEKEFSNLEKFMNRF